MGSQEAMKARAFDLIKERELLNQKVLKLSQEIARVVQEIERNNAKKT